MKKFFSLFWNYLKKSDTLLLGLCIAATVYGIVLIRTSTAYLSSSNAASVQILALFIGIALYFVFSLIDIDILADNWKLLFAAGIGMLGLLVFAQEEGGNRAWLRFMGIGIQPAEIVKIFFIVIIAKLIVSFSHERRLDHILSLGAMTGILLIYFGMILVLSSDLGSGLVYLFIFIAMLFAGGLKIYWFLIAFAGFAIVEPRYVDEARLQLADELGVAFGRFGKYDQIIALRKRLYALLEGLEDVLVVIDWDGVGVVEQGREPLGDDAREHTPEPFAASAVAEENVVKGEVCRLLAVQRVSDRPCLMLPLEVEGHHHGADHGGVIADKYRRVAVRLFFIDGLCVREVQPQSAADDLIVDVAQLHVQTSFRISADRRLPVI